MQEAAIEEFFSRRSLPALLGEYAVGKRAVSYAVIGGDHLPAFLFLHDAPGSMLSFASFYQNPILLRSFSLYAVDRPGYGLTGGSIVPSFEKSAALLLPLAASIHRVHQPLILVASGFSAGMACRLAIDQPELIQALVLLAPELEMGSVKQEGWKPLVGKTFLRRLLPENEQAALEERKGQEAQLKKLSKLWKKLSVPVVYIQSEKDKRTNKDVAFARQQLVSLPFFDVHILPGRHSVLDVKHAERIAAIVTALANKIL